MPRAGSTRRARLGLALRRRETQVRRPRAGGPAGARAPVGPSPATRCCRSSLTGVPSSEGVIPSIYPQLLTARARSSGSANDARSPPAPHQAPARSYRKMRSQPQARNSASTTGLPPPPFEVSRPRWPAGRDQRTWSHAPEIATVVTSRGEGPLRYRGGSGARVEHIRHRDAPRRERRRRGPSLDSPSRADLRPAVTEHIEAGGLIPSWLPLHLERRLTIAGLEGRPFPDFRQRTLS